MLLKMWSGDNKAVVGIVESPQGVSSPRAVETLCGILASDDGGAK